MAFWKNMVFKASVGRFFRLLSLGVVFQWMWVEYLQAQPERIADKLHGYSLYEQESIAYAERKYDSAVDPAPEGKVIEGIEILSLDVFEKRDPFPSIFNSLHVLTRSHIIEREVLLVKGGFYEQQWADETARNLLQLRPLAFALCVPLKGSTPHQVRLVVITKDLWSLRLDGNFSGTFASSFEQTFLQFKEINIAGVHQMAAVLFELRNDTYFLGERYIIPRVLDTRINVGVSLGVFINRETHSQEGFSGKFSVQQPLYSTFAKWAGGISGLWGSKIVRHYVGGRLARYQGRSANEEISDRSNMPYEYGHSFFLIEPMLTRSFGSWLKHDWTLGGQFKRDLYHVNDFPDLDPSLVAEFIRSRVPPTETRVYPYIQYRTYTTQFLRGLDFELFALQENFRLGHDFYVRVYPILCAFGSSRNVMGMLAGLQYTLPLGTGFTRFSINSLTEMQTDASVSDASIQLNGRVNSPRTWAGRFVFDSVLLNRYKNFLNQRDTIGAYNRLRGYPSNWLMGSDFVAANLEFRSWPIQAFSCQFGGVLFYDMAGAFDTFSKTRLYRSFGFGLRALLPQISRLVFRIDMGFPLNQNSPFNTDPSLNIDSQSHILSPRVEPFSISFGLGQAFPLNSIQEDWY
ncbi:hypothetical protein [Pajaroellobacter abortibovis]|nr:hypothetical protein [Pajaroellobacter abortibovis]